MHRTKPLAVISCAACLLAQLLCGCSKKVENRLVIWTDNSEFVQYAEIYNESHKTKAVLVYKEDLAASLPPMRDELMPDVIAGSWLRNSRVKRNFVPLDFLFERRYLTSSAFYSVLLEAGTTSHRQYLLPVNFNLPAIIFSAENEDRLETSYTISLEQLRKTGATYNKKNKKDKYTAIGFAPQSSRQFLYTVAKMKRADFRQGAGNSFLWNQDALSESISFLKEWISTENPSPAVENDFVYKYLSETDDKRVTGGRTLFSYMTSDKLFQLSKEQLSQLGFRWLENEGTIPVEDSMIMTGISAKSAHKADAAEFISWLFTPDTQRSIMERKARMNLNNMQFGIAGGFSAVKDVTEQILPVYYTQLLTNIPQADSFYVSSKKPRNWEQIKANAVIPYITESVAAVSDKKTATLEERYAELKKQGY